MNVRFAIHSMSCPSVATRAASPDIVALRPKSCIIIAPPIQTIAIEMWTKRRSAYQLTDGA